MNAYSLEFGEVCPPVERSVGEDWGPCYSNKTKTKTGMFEYTHKINDFFLERAFTIKPQHQPLDVPNRLRTKLPDIFDRGIPIGRTDGDGQIRDIHLRSYTTPFPSREDVRREPIMDM